MQVLKRIVWCGTVMEANGLITTAPTRRNSTAKRLRVGNYSGLHIHRWDSNRGYDNIAIFLSLLSGF